MSCNSNTIYDKKVLNNLNKYEISAKELTAHFDSLAPIDNLRDTNFHSLTLYSNQIIESENEIYKKYFPLPQTKKLCLESPPAFIFINSDTSVYFNTWNSESSIFKTFAHFVCFVPNNKGARFDFLTHPYKIVKTKKLKQNWTYVIIEEGFD